MKTRNASELLFHGIGHRAELTSVDLSTSTSLYLMKDGIAFLVSKIATTKQNALNIT